MVKTPCFHQGGTGSIPGPGPKILHVMWHDQEIKKKKNFVAYNNKLEILCYSNVGWAELSGYKRRSISFVYLLLTPNSSGHQVGGVSLPNQTIP